MFKIALLGTENSHARAFCNLIYKGDAMNGNVPYADFEVIGLCGDSTEENEILKEITGGKAEISENGDKWVDEVDAIMVTARSGAKHLAYAKKYIEAGKPAFIDKPITIDPEEALELVRLAKKNNVPLCGGSSLGVIEDTQKMKALRNNADKMERVFGGSVSAPINMKNEWGDFFFYSQHLVQIMTEVFGHDVESIIGVKRDDAATFIARYADYDVTGHYGTMGYSATIYAKNETHHLNLSLANAYRTEFQRFEHMVRTGGMPESYEELINPVFILNAIHEAINTGKEVKVVKPVI
ncbi:MAG: hypothetical protein E7473_08360 [Ruminococcaceae bacterium]|nr:hypothetical protein [Oscillospiraceae bacterium]